MTSTAREMHDGIIVPRSKADLAKGILAMEYRWQVGVEPMLTGEPDPQDFDARYLSTTMPQSGPIRLRPENSN
jgi:hypothetical protein